jgi:hypothetical protein
MELATLHLRPGDSKLPLCFSPHCCNTQ